METGAPDLLVAPATTLAALRRDDWEVPEAVERLTEVAGLARRVERSVRRATAADAGRTTAARR
jgi:hypothetical protein